MFAQFDLDPDVAASRPVSTFASAPFAAETVTLRPSPQCPGIAMRPAQPPLRPSTHRPRRAWSAVTAIGVLLAACCFWQGLPALSSLWRDEAQANVVVEAPQRELVHTKIKDLRPLQRVIAQNPQLAGQHVPERKINPATDRLVSFKLTHPDGSTVQWERVESLPELVMGVLSTDETAFDKLSDDVTDDTTGAAPSQSLIGRTLDVELSEFGVSGPATIVGVAPCPEPEAYDGPDRRLITAVFRHTSMNIVDLTLDDGTPSIGCTGNHPYWSVDRQDFVRADQLRQGETLQSADGSLCHVASVMKRHLTEPVAVYNLEIDGHHVYSVGEGGVLVHNLCGKDLQGLGARREATALADIRAKHPPNAEILPQRTLRGADGRRLVDATTETGRRTDYVVLEDGKVVAIYEVTGTNVIKDAQTEKTKRLIEAGAFIRRPGETTLIEIPNTLVEKVLRYD
jgi:hypothetical protein